MGRVLLESIGSTDEEGVKGFCETLYSWLTGGGGGGEEEEEQQWAGSGAKTEGARLLDAPIQLSTKLKITGRRVFE